MADTSGFIDRFVDFDEAPERAVYGYKIKLAGEAPEVWVYFVPEDEPGEAVKVTRIAENTLTKITGIEPDTKHWWNRIEIRTQFTGSGNSVLKAPRTIASGFVLEAAG